MSNEICRKDIPYPSVSGESVPSLINNLVNALYGDNVTKSVINRQVVWNTPCDPNNTAQIAWLPRLQGEGLLCYMLRAFNATFVAEVTLDGVQTLTNKTLTSPIINSPSVSNLVATGSLTLPNASVIPANLSAGAPSWNGAGTLTTTGLTVTGSLTLPTGSISAGAIADGSITNADINASAAIANSKLAGNPTTANTANAIVLRDGSGNFSANIITSNLTGIATNATNLQSGLIGSIPYQSAVNTTAMLANSVTTGTILTATAGGAPAWSTDHKGTATNNDVPAAGYVGEYVTTNVASASAVPITSATTANIANISLTAGDWDIGGVVGYTLTGVTSTFSANGFLGGASTTNATLGAEGTYFIFPADLTTKSGAMTFNIPAQRISINATTTLFLVARATFAAGTLGAWGRIYARRAR
jgi:hypothetical protein